MVKHVAAGVPTRADDGTASAEETDRDQERLRFASQHGSLLSEKLLRVACDVALVLDELGEVLEIAAVSPELEDVVRPDWVGRRLTDVATPETRAKAVALIESTRFEPYPRARQLNHPSRAEGGGTAADTPITYRLTRLNDDGLILAVGSDQRPISSAQQRLVAAQQELEREYAEMRGMETRFRHVFHAMNEALLLVETGALRIAEANPAAERLFGVSAQRLMGRSLLDGLDAASADAVRALARDAGSAAQDERRARVTARGRPLLLVASGFRQNGAAMLLVRAADQADSDGGPPVQVFEADGPAAAAAASAALRGPDAFAAIAASGEIRFANQAFLDLINVATLQQAAELTVDEVLGRTVVDAEALLLALKERGVLRSQPAAVRARTGAVEEVELSATRLDPGAPADFGFFMRLARRRDANAWLAGSPDELTHMVGRVPLKTLVRDTTDVIERLCIEAALRVTGDNRASAAEMLGLSRQSLYVKLRRFGLVDPDADPD